MDMYILFGVLIVTYLMVVAKRIGALIRGFQNQSIFLFLATLFGAMRRGHADLYVVSALLLLIKVIAIPYVLRKIVKEIKVNDNLGFFINPQLSVICALALTYFSWTFSKYFILSESSFQVVALTVALTVVLIGGFIMIFRMKALAQIIGLLVMENGIFLLGSNVAGGMPFFIETAVFFDVFVSVLILGAFVYRINRLFTHIDVNKLSRLKG